MNQGFNMQDVMRMAMPQGQGMLQGGQLGAPSGMTQEQYMQMLRQMQQSQMAMQMMRAGQPVAQQQAMPLGLMNFLGN